MIDLPGITVHNGDALETLAAMPAESAQMCVTSPPYWGLRDYGADGQIGLEPTPEQFVSRLVEVFREVRRVLKDDGTLWLNLGDSYAGSWGNQGRKEGRGTQRPINGPMLQQFRKASAPAHAVNCDMDEDCSCGVEDAPKYPERRNTGSWVRDHPTLKPKDLIGVPWRVAFALQADGWFLRSDIIWHKPNPMPESVRDRPTKAHEYLFLLAKSERYHYDAAAVCEQPSGRNRRTVWTVPTRPFFGAHFATFPPDLIEPCILAGSRPGDVVLDPFNGAGTTGLVSYMHGRQYVGIELNPEYVEITRKRLTEATAQGRLFGGAA